MGGSLAGMRVVVKYGGAAMQSQELLAMVCEDAAALQRAGARLALVHGGGPELSAFMRALGKEPVFVDGLRYTDADTIDAAVMTLSGKVNKGLVARIARAGGRAAGLCGADGALLSCARMREPDLGFVGDAPSVDTRIIEALWDAGLMPVVSTVGLAADSADTLFYNVNADTAAGAIAAALNADRFVSMSDVPGVLRDVDDPASLIECVAVGGIEALVADGTIAGGMIPKVRGAAEVVLSGAKEASIIDGRVPHALLRELAEGGAGTRVVR